MFGEFKAFLLKTNALALAVGVIIGVALGSVVNSLVNDIILPPIGMLLGKVDFSSLKVVLQPGVGTDPTAAGYVSEVAIRWGMFLNAVIAFIVISLVVWQIGKAFMKEPPPAEVKTCPFCMESNAPNASKCKACTSAI